MCYPYYFFQMTLTPVTSVWYPLPILVTNRPLSTAQKLSISMKSSLMISASQISCISLKVAKWQRPGIVALSEEIIADNFSTIFLNKLLDIKNLHVCRCYFIQYTSLKDFIKKLFLLF